MEKKNYQQTIIYLILNSLVPVVSLFKQVLFAKKRWCLFLTTAICLFSMLSIGFSKEKKLAKRHYKIYSVKQGEKIKIDSLIEDLENYDVIFFGEEHNDFATHYLQNLIFRRMYEKWGSEVALSMEMFYRDVQLIMDEYLKGYIRESYFKKDARAWPNYKDYRPMIEFAKENNLYVIAANAPWRYINVVSNDGQEALQSLSDRAKTFIAPLPYDTATGDYYEKLKSMFSYTLSHTVNDSSTSEDSLSKQVPAMPEKKPNRILGQSLWDATMAYSIYEYLKENPGKKILHLNGRFHTDGHFGIVQQLKKYNPALRLLVISAAVDRSGKYPRVDFEQHQQLGDYIIITNPKLPRSYESKF